MRIGSIGRAGGVVALMSFACTSSVLAHSSVTGEERANLEELTELADLVAVGTVASVEYVVAAAEGEEGTVPYTIVTYHLEEKVRGIIKRRSTGKVQPRLKIKPDLKQGSQRLKKLTQRAEKMQAKAEIAARELEDSTLVLKFVGGADGMGGFMSVIGVPQFQEGERDILFVQSNGEDERCPLVNCEYGRYRISGNQVFNTHGQPVRGIVGNGAVARGKRNKAFEKFSYPTPSFDNLMKNPAVLEMIQLTGAEIESVRRDYDLQKPAKITITTAPSSELANDSAGKDPDAKGRRSGGRARAVIGSRPIGKDAMMKKIKELHGKSKRAPNGIVSADRNKPIVLRVAQLQAAGDPGEQRAQPKGTPEELEEIRALQEQGGNPVLQRNR